MTRRSFLLTLAVVGLAPLLATAVPSSTTLQAAEWTTGALVAGDVFHFTGEYGAVVTGEFVVVEVQGDTITFRRGRA